MSKKNFVYYWWNSKRFVRLSFNQDAGVLSPRAGCVRTVADWYLQISWPGYKIPSWNEIFQRLASVWFSKSGVAGKVGGGGGGGGLPGPLPYTRQWKLPLVPLWGLSGEKVRDTRHMCRYTFAHLRVLSLLDFPERKMPLILLKLQIRSYIPVLNVGGQASHPVALCCMSDSDVGCTF